MGSGGGIFDPVDSFSGARLNQKSTFVGTGTAIDALATTYPGMQAYSTDTSDAFTIDTLYVRNAANDAWAEIAQFTGSITATVETDSTPVTDGADFTATAGVRYYAFHTLPSTEMFYMIRGITWKNGATVAGNITTGVDVVNADPPTLASTPLAALAQEVAQAGTSAIQRVSIVASEMIPGGTIIGAWVSCSSSSATLREETGLGSQNQSKATSYSAGPPTSDSTAWTAATARKYLIIHYLGFH